LTLTLAPTGFMTETAVTTANNGSIIGQITKTTTADKETVTTVSDSDGVGIADSTVTSNVLAGGLIRTDTVFRTSGGGELAHEVTTKTADGLRTTTARDANGDGTFEFVSESSRLIRRDGWIIDEVAVRNHHHVGLAKRVTETSDDNLSFIVRLDQNGDGQDDAISEDRTILHANGSRTRVQETFDQFANRIALNETVTSGNGLEVTSTADYTGDGNHDRITYVVQTAEGAASFDTSGYGAGLNLQWQRVETRSADGRLIEVALDRDGDGWTEVSVTSVQDLSGIWTATHKTFADGGDITGIFTSTTSANGLDVTFGFDVDGDGVNEFSRASWAGFASDGRRITTRTETHGANEVTYNEVTSESTNGLVSITQYDTNGDGVFDGTTTRTTTLHTHGARTVVSETRYTDGSLRAKSVESVAADGRNIVNRFDNDGNGIYDLVSTRITAADGSATVTDRSYLANGLPSGAANGLLSGVAYTLTSADGLSTTIIRGTGSQTFTRSTIDPNSYSWTMGAVSASHMFDGIGIETWSHSEAGITRTVRLDSVAKNMIADDAARIYDALLDRDLDVTERESLIKYIVDGRLDSSALAAALLASTEFTTRYPDLSAAEFITRMSLNALGRAPSLAEVANHLASLTGSTAAVNAARATFALSLALSEEHILVGNGHVATNNFDVFLNPAEVERTIDLAYARDLAARMVDVAFDRDATKQELDHLSGRILLGVETTAAIAGSLIASAVDGAIQGVSSKSLSGLSGAAFVQQAFLNAFGRMPTDIEQGFWQGAIASGQINTSQFISLVAMSMEALAASASHLVYTAPTVTISSITGTAGHDSLTGTTGSDTLISGLAGSDKLRSGTGSDTMSGGTGSDIYFWKTTDGIDRIQDGGISLLETDVLRLEGIAVASVTLNRSNLAGDLVISVVGQSATLTVAAHFASMTTGSGIESIVFDDGTTWDLNEIAARSGTVDPDDSTPNNNIGWGTFTDTLEGQGGSDTLSGSAGNDRLTGGTGLDTLKGGAGSDTYNWTRGHGGDLIDDNGTSTTDIDRLILTDVLASAVTLDRDEATDDLLIIISGTDGATLRDINRFSSQGNGIETIQFMDGQIWQLADIVSMVHTQDGSDFSERIVSLSSQAESINARGGDDTITGGQGDDTIEGGNGSDTFIWSMGSVVNSHGNDTILDSGTNSGEMDTLFLNDVSSSRVTLERRIGDSWVDEDLYVRVAFEFGQFAMISLKDVFISGKTVIERIRFADGEEWVLDEIEDRIKTIGISASNSIGGGSLDDNIFGGIGQDIINAGNGDDEITGNGGIDFLDGSAGNDIYFWKSTDGSDSISDSSISTTDTDVLVLVDRNYADVGLSKSGNNLLITAGGSTITVVNRFVSANEGRGIEKIVFQDGIVVEVLSDPAATSVLSGTSGDETLNGWAFRDLIAGNAGNDTLFGNAGNDELSGGLGNDTLYGGTGSDTYIWSKNTGTDRFDDLNSTSSSVDTLRLDDALPAEVILHRPSNDDALYVYVGGVIAGYVINQFADASKFMGIEVIEFADGTSWNLTQIWENTKTIPQGLASVYGSAWNDYILGTTAVDNLFGGKSYDLAELGDDTFQGAGGADIIYDDTGSETYIWSKGDGTDVYWDQGLAADDIDRLVLRDVASTEVDLVHFITDTHLRVSITSTSEIFTFASQFYDSANRGVDLIEFSDGVIWTREDILEHTRMSGTANDDTINGSAFRDRIFGNAGNDSLSGLAGDDRLDGRTGNDSLLGSAGSDTYVWRLADGNDTISDSATDPADIDTLELVNVASTGVQLRRASGGDYLVVHITGQANWIRVDGQFDGPDIATGIERITFSDGVIWSLQDIEANTTTYGNGILTTILGGDHNDNIFGTSPLAETLLGNGGDDTLIGNGGGDKLDGGAGVDIVSYRNATQGVSVDINIQNGTGQTGNAGGEEVGDILISVEGVEGSNFGDLLQGNNGSDDIWGLNGNDTIYGFTGYDRLFGGAGNDRLYGQDSSDLLSGEVGNDSLFGGEGADTIDGGSGNDLLQGDAGDDTYIIDSLGDVIVEAAGQGLVDRVMTGVSWALAADDAIEELMTLDLLGLSAINLTGNLFSQTITGNAGENVLSTGGTAADTLIGGAGNDTYFVFVATDTVIDLAGGGGLDTIITTHSRSLSAIQEIEILTVSAITGTGAINLIGNAYGQTLIGNNGVNVIYGGGVGVVDTFIGHAGNDDYLLYNSGDKIEEATGEGSMDRVLIDASYLLAADDDIECLKAFTAMSTTAINLTGNGLAQIIIGNAGNNQLSDGGAAGVDTLQGGTGNDTYIVRNAGAILVEGLGQGTQDRLRTEISFVLASDDDIERLEAIAPTSVLAINLTANAINQTLIGNDGTNRLDGLGGADTLSGLGGDDTFVFSTPTGATNIDTITDFGLGDDQIELKVSVFTTLSVGALSAGAFVSNTTGLATTSNHRIIYESDTGFLFYDADGTGASARVQFAVLAVGTVLATADFLVA
jgi:Ca2+-binding RTX toxin-like protein